MKEIQINLINLFKNIKTSKSMFDNSKKSLIIRKMLSKNCKKTRKKQRYILKKIKKTTITKKPINFWTYSRNRRAIR